jgi:hypothetical protein
MRQSSTEKVRPIICVQEAVIEVLNIRSKQRPYKIFQQETMGSASPRQLYCGFIDGSGLFERFPLQHGEGILNIPSRAHAVQNAGDSWRAGQDP